MKRMLILVLPALLVLVLGTCTKSAETSSEYTPANLTFKVDGNKYSFEGSSILAKDTMNNLIITVPVSTDESITVGTFGTALGSYAIGTDAIGLISMHSAVCNSMELFPPEGQVILSRYDKNSKRVSGTFYFDGLDDDNGLHHVAQGSFSNVPVIVSR
jgi:hypothetical protein